VNFTEAVAMMVAVDLAVVILKMRAPGMSLRRMPIFCWATLVTSIMIMFAMPIVMLAANLVQLDRMIGSHFFNPGEGGDPVLWQHIFWWFGHPEVYIIFLPGLAFISAIVPTFARRPMVGHEAVVLSLIATGFLSFGLWVHHMFAANIPEVGKSFFTAMSFMIAIPSAIQLCCWIATLATGRLNVKVPLLFIFGFFFILVIGGLTGILLGSVPVDLQVHDTQFVVAHLHYVLIGGAVFPLFAAFYFWFPKVTGRMMSERLGRWQFALFFIGFKRDLLAAAPARARRHATAHLHVCGRDRMGDPQFRLDDGCARQRLQHAAPRREHLLEPVERKARAGESLGGFTLEWATPSPPPAFNFVRIPIVASREPPLERSCRGAHSRERPFGRDPRGTRDHGAGCRPRCPLWLSGPDLVALRGRHRGRRLADLVGVFRHGFLLGNADSRGRLHRMVLAEEGRERSSGRLGEEPVTRREAQPASVPRRAARERARRVAAPSYGFGHRSLMWWGTAAMMAIEGVAFAFMIIVYFYLRALSDTWPYGAPDPDLFWGR
jgi:cytochrome c oxidase subunit 1/cytochrome c oxidase subunit I+III